MNNPSQIQIAIVEDQPLFRKGIQHILSAFPLFNVMYECDNGQVLLHKLTNTNYRPDICLLDINMPILDGYKTAYAIHKKYPYIKTIALSTHSSEYNIIKMLIHGANGYLTKDVTAEELYTAICQVYGGSNYISKELHSICKRIFNEAHKNHKYDLTERELIFIKLCCTELTYKQIADKMRVTLRTVDGYRESIFEKLETTCRTGIVLFAMKAGIEVIK